MSPIQALSGQVTPIEIFDQLGIKIKQTESAAELTELFFQESLNLDKGILSSQTKIYLQGQNGQTLSTEPSQINKSDLIQALHQVIQNLNHTSASQLNKEVHNLLISMSATAAEKEYPLLVLDHLGTQVTINPNTLTLENIMQTFQSSLHELGPKELKENYLQLESLSHDLKVAFTSYSQPTEEVWQHLQSLINQPSVPIEQHLKQLLGFQVFNSEQSAQHLLDSVEHSPPMSPMDLSSLSQRTQALIEKANQLAEALELAPQPNTPQISELFKAFLAIFQDLEKNTKILLRKELSKIKANKTIVDAYIERLHSELKYHEEKLSQMSTNKTLRFKFGLYQMLDVALSQVELLPHPQKYQQLQKSLENLKLVFQV